MHPSSNRFSLSSSPSDFGFDRESGHKLCMDGLDEPQFDFGLSHIQHAAGTCVSALAALADLVQTLFLASGIDRIRLACLAASTHTPTHEHTHFAAVK